MPAISVLMPVYNAERFLSSAIESILNQTFTDFEFLIIDDCSTDNSVNIIKSYNDPRIAFYQNEKNLGITPTLNNGIKLAGTDLIARMDSDDISSPERLQVQYEFIESNPDGALYSCWVKVIGQQGQFLRQDNFESRFYYYNLTFICWIYHPSVVFRKKAVEAVGMYTVLYGEDFELFWQLSRRYKIYNVPAVLLDYRVTDQSLHQVLKKKEYRASQYEQLLRNFRYYAGENYIISEAFIDCLQHNFKPLQSANNVDNVVTCIRELDLLTGFILAKENINRDDVAIKSAAFFKRKFIVEHFVGYFSLAKSFILLVKLKEYNLLKKTIKDAVKKVLRNEKG